MTRRVIVIGAGMGGLTAAIRLARRGLSVRVIEAREQVGGLASSFEKDGLRFDVGPYILLDRTGLDWAFRSVGLDLSEQVTLEQVHDVYDVEWPDGDRVRLYSDLDSTALEMDRKWPGSGKRYERFVTSTWRIYNRLQSLLFAPHTGPRGLVATGAWRHAGFLLSSLGSVLARTGLPQPVVDAISIWIHVAGQSVRDAPSPMAFVPALIHRVGAYYPTDGIASIPRALERAAVEAGVGFSFGRKVKSIRCEGSGAQGVETEMGEYMPADAIVSNAHGVGTYLELVQPAPSRALDRLEKLPLQSPGVCAYLAVKGVSSPPYLRFHLPGHGELCRLLVTPSVLAPEQGRDGWWPARLLSPMRQAEAERMGPEEQRAHLDKVLGERWWRDYVGEARIVTTRTRSDWGRDFNLYHDSMNPVMTARFMRKGRLAHRSPYLKGLYLAGSSTHPGQWVSFCAISGILAADQLAEDFSNA